VDASRAQEAPRLGSQPSGVFPTTASLAAYPGKAAAKGVPTGAPKPLSVKLLPPSRPLAFDKKLKEIKHSGRPVVTKRDPGVGKPLKAGVEAPPGIRSASAPSAKGQGPHPKEPSPGRTPRPPSSPAHPGQAGGLWAHPKPGVQRPPEDLRVPDREPGGPPPGKAKAPPEKVEGKAKKPAEPPGPSNPKADDPKKQAADKKN